MIRMSDEELERIASDLSIVSIEPETRDLARELRAARKVVEAARLQNTPNTRLREALAELDALGDEE